MSKDREWLKDKIEDAYLESEETFEASGWETAFEKLTISKKELFSLIDQLDEPEKVVVHPHFEQWYSEIKRYWHNQEDYKAFAIKCINQMGFGSGLENAQEEDVSDEYSKLRKVMQANKELYTRAVLDGYTVEKQPKWIVLSMGVYFKQFKASINGEIDWWNTRSVKDRWSSNDKTKAEAIALLIDGKVEEVMV